MASVTLDYDYDVDHEVSALESARKEARVPRRKSGRLLVASWNIARLGGNERRDEDYKLLATMIGWFELVALQEVRDNLAGLRAIQANLPRPFRVLFSDSAGNNERMAFVYDSRKVSPLEEIGEIGFSPRELAAVRKAKVGRPFQSFDRTPHLAAFEAERARFLLANVHLYYGSATELARRAAEAFAVASWAERRQGEKHTYTKNVLALGDFNLPRADPTDAIYQALVTKGLRVPKDVATRIGTNLSGGKQYDQVVFLPEAEGLLRESGVVRFDDVLFRDLAQAKRRPLLRYRISDHRILWFTLATDEAGARARTRAGPPAPGELVAPG
jgi:endonuclease/exonuclease/phosphatase family metal-dependent hydrolase